MRDEATVCVSEDSFQKSVLLPPCRFQGWNSRHQISYKHFYLLSYLLALVFSLFGFWVLV